MTLPFLMSYGGQTTEDLIALESRYRTDSLVLAFEEAIQQKSNPSVNETYVLAVEGMEREVNNGGWWQFFMNSSGQYAGVIEQALRAIGCPQTATIARDAVAALGISGELTAQTVADTIAAGREELEGRLEAFDERYFAGEEAIGDRLFDWIKANQATIRVGG